MKNISELFGKIQNRFAKEAATRLIVREILKDKTGIELPIEAISFSSTTLILKGLSSTARSALFTKKPAILEEIRLKSIGRSVIDVRFEG